MFTVPNYTDSGITGNPQSLWTATDIAILMQSLNGEGVSAGCAVTAHGSPDLAVAVASGQVRLAGDVIDVAGVDVTIATADPFVPRVDLIVADDSGVVSASSGAAAANPIPGPIPSSSVVLAMVYVPASATSIIAARIVDKRAQPSPTGALLATTITVGAPDPAGTQQVTIQVVQKDGGAGFRLLPIYFCTGADGTGKVAGPGASTITFTAGEVISGDLDADGFAWIVTDSDGQIQFTIDNSAGASTYVARVAVHYTTGVRVSGALAVPLPAVPIMDWLFDEGSGQQAFNAAGPMTPSGNLLHGNAYGLSTGNGDAIFPTQVNATLTDRYDGRASRIVSAGGSADCYLSSVSIPFTAAQYTASAYVKSNTGSDVTFKMWKLGGGDNIQSSSLTAHASGYTRVTFTFTATAADSPFIPFYDNGVPSLDISMRDLKLEQASSASAYVPDAFDFTLGRTGAVDADDPSWASEGLACAGDNHFAIAMGETPQAFTAISIYVAATVTTNGSYRPLLSTPFDDGQIRLAAAQSMQPRARFGGTDAVANAATVADTLWHIYQLVYDGTTLRLFIDEACIASADASGLSVSDVYAWYLANFNTLGLDGSIGVARVYDVAHSPAARLATLSTLRAIMAGRSVPMTALPTWCVFEGDSIMAGLTASDVDHALPLLALRDLSPIPQGRNLAVSGSSMSDLATRAAATDAVLVAGATNILTVLDGANDLGGSETAADFVADLKAYCQARQAAGWTVVVCTVLPRTAGGFNTKRNAANVLIRGDASFYDALADIGDTGTTMGADAAAADTDLYADGTHPTDDGYADLYAIVSAAIGSVI